MVLQVHFYVSLAFQSGLRLKSVSWGPGQDTRAILINIDAIQLCNHTGQVCHRLDLGNKDCFAGIFSFYYI